MGSYEFYERVFRGLNKRRVSYAVVGGIAVNLHGFVRATMDLDIVMLLERRNIEKFIALVEEMGFKPRMPVDLRDFCDDARRSEWINDKGMKVFCVYNPKCPSEQIDVLVGDETDTEGLFKRRQTMKLGTVSVPVVSIDDLIRLKEKAGRQRDVIDIAALRRIRELNYGRGKKKA